MEPNEYVDTLKKRTGQQKEIADAMDSKNSKARIAANKKKATTKKKSDPRKK